MRLISPDLHHDADQGPVRDPSQRLSAKLYALANTGAARLSVIDLVSALDERAFGSALLMLAFPAVLLPPLVSAVLGAPLLIVSSQMIVNGRLILPAAVGRLSLSRRHAAAALEHAGRNVARMERVLRPRLQALQHPWHLKIVAVVCLVMSLVLCLPTPIAHTAAGLSIGTFAAGILHRDGLALLVGWALAACCLLLLAILVGGAVVGLKIL